MSIISKSIRYSFPLVTAASFFFAGMTLPATAVQPTTLPGKEIRHAPNAYPGPFWKQNKRSYSKTNTKAIVADDGAARSASDLKKKKDGTRSGMIEPLITR